MIRSIPLALALAACGSARVLEVTQAGGTIVLSGDRDAAMDEANRKMAAHCGANHYTIEPTGDRVRYRCT